MTDKNTTKPQELWQSRYLRVRNNLRILAHWHEHERAVLFRFAEAEFVRQPGGASENPGDDMQMPTAKAQAKADFSRIWPFGKDCGRVDHSGDLDSLYLAVGLVLDRLFESRVFVTKQMMAEIKSGCRLFLGNEATDEMIFECLGPYWNGHPMTCSDAEDLWELIEKDIEAWPDNHTYGPAWMHADGHNTSEVGPSERTEHRITIHAWHKEMLKGPIEWGFEAFGQSFEIEVEPIRAKDLIEAFSRTDVRVEANTAAAQILNMAAEYDVEARRQYTFPLRWLQEYWVMPAFLEKLGRPAGFDLFDKSDWIDYRQFELQVLPRLQPLPGKKTATPYDGPEIWQTERSQYVLGHPYGYVYMEQPGCPSEDRDAQLFFLAVLHDEAVGINKVVRQEVRAISPGFYAVVVEYCSGLASRSPQTFIALLAELSNDQKLKRSTSEVPTGAGATSEPAGDQVGETPGSGGEKPPGSEEPAADPDRPLTSRARIIKQKLLSLQENEGMTLPQLQEWYETQAVADKEFPPDTPKTLDEGTWKRVRKELLPHGLKNRQNVGYYIPKK